MTMGNNSQQQLKSFIERVERLEEEISGLTDDRNDIYTEAKGNGFDVKALRAIVRMRKEDTAKREAHEALVDTYKHALGMLSDLPLGQSAIERMAANPSVRRAVKNLGTPVELTEEEKAKGYSAAFIGKDGTRMSIGAGNGIGKQVDLEEAIAAKS